MTPAPPSRQSRPAPATCRASSSSPGTSAPAPATPRHWPRSTRPSSTRPGNGRTRRDPVEKRLTARAQNVCSLIANPGRMTSTDSLLHAAEPGLPPPPPAPHRAQVEIVIPVRNEDRDLAPSVRRLHAYLDRTFPFDTRITIADNGSTDGTWAQAQALAGELAPSARCGWSGPGAAGRCAPSGRPATP